MRAVIWVVAFGINLMTMPKDCHATISGYLVLSSFYFIVFEFEDIPTNSADQVIVMCAKLCDFKSCLAFGKMSLFGNARFNEKAERSIDSSKSYIRLVNLH